MSIATKLQKILDSKAAIKAAIAGKGGTITDATPLDEYDTAVQSIPSGQSEDDVIRTVCNRGFTRANIPDGVTAVGDSAFYNCTGLTSLAIPNSVTSIGASAFSRTAITSLTIPSSVLSIAVSAFSNNSSLRNLTIEEGLETIAANCFLATNITRFIFPNSLKTIGDYALSTNTRITYVDFGTGIQTIGGQALIALNGTIVVRATTPPTLRTNFVPPNFVGKIYVPDASVNDYKTATNWSTWASYIYPLSEYQT